MKRLVSLLFGGCSHKRTSFPMSPRKGSGNCYVACLDCGREFSYDWNEMRMGEEISSQEKDTTFSFKFWRSLAPKPQPQNDEGKSHTTISPNEDLL